MFVVLSVESTKSDSVPTRTLSIAGNCVSKRIGNACVKRFPVKSMNVAVIVYSPSAVPSRGITASVLQVKMVFVASVSIFLSGITTP